MRIIRFLSGGSTCFGVPVDERSARRIEGDLFGSFRVTDQTLPIDKLLAPIVPTDILCIGLNYREHAAESGSPIPRNPMLFLKASNTLNNPGDPIPIPRRSREIDYEAELAVVIGKAARHVSRQQALDYVLGYTCANDVSARDWQRDKDLGGGQFARGKSFDGFCPLGPWIVTKDEIPDPNALRIRCVLNGNVMQDHTTADMIFSVPELIESLSSTMTLRPGSVILTGTPQGVGFARTPPVWLKAGDTVSIELERIGTLTNPVVNEP
ncbi:MAG: fumarylacetoacetate hydrolase family protein [Phycisphaerae bacterium]|nr:fumarylacetoacetate hydrolase family protein [Phycisphaerae bacterium]MDW8262486.1 fumarylacetoacetate hydrolase family protein [Phycisphaerales bacterium]